MSTQDSDRSGESAPGAHAALPVLPPAAISLMLHDLDPRSQAALRATCTWAHAAGGAGAGGTHGEPGAGAGASAQHGGTTSAATGAVHGAGKRHGVEEGLEPAGVVGAPETGGHDTDLTRANTTHAATAHATVHAAPAQAQTQLQQSQGPPLLQSDPQPEHLAADAAALAEQCAQLGSSLDVTLSLEVGVRVGAVLGEGVVGGGQEEVVVELKEEEEEEEEEVRGEGADAEAMAGAAPPSSGQKKQQGAGWSEVGLLTVHVTPVTDASDAQGVAQLQRVLQALAPLTPHLRLLQLPSGPTELLPHVLPHISSSPLGQVAGRVRVHWGLLPLLAHYSAPDLFPAVHTLHVCGVPWEAGCSWQRDGPHIAAPAVHISDWHKLVDVCMLLPGINTVVLEGVWCGRVPPAMSAQPLQQLLGQAGRGEVHVSITGTV